LGALVRHERIAPSNFAGAVLILGGWLLGMRPDRSA
jgi:hypothetical protein